MASSFPKATLSTPPNKSRPSGTPVLVDHGAPRLVNGDSGKIVMRS